MCKVPPERFVSTNDLVWERSALRLKNGSAFDTDFSLAKEEPADKLSACSFHI